VPNPDNRARTPKGVDEPVLHLSTIVRRLFSGGNYVLIFVILVLDSERAKRNPDNSPLLSAQKQSILYALFGACLMSEQVASSASEAATVSFGERLANSQAFTDLFRDGMSLVEETASYLDGPGRQESKKLDRSASLAYATESMRLTTRLMQLASWLLLHRAVKEGEMSLAQASKEKSKVKLTAADNDDNNYKVLPERLRHLIDRSRNLQVAIRRLDSTMHSRRDPGQPPAVNPVETQSGLLKAAFEQE
jgi:regulator of CtrA degradation